MHTKRPTLIAFIVFTFSFVSVCALPLRDFRNNRLAARAPSAIEEALLYARTAPSADAQAVVKWIHDHSIASGSKASGSGGFSSKTLLFYGGFTSAKETNREGPKLKQKHVWQHLREFKDWMGKQGIKLEDIDDIVASADRTMASKTFEQNLDWSVISEALAMAASGKVYVLEGQNMPPDRIWQTIEKPALLANTKVKEIKVFEFDRVGKFHLKGYLKKNGQAGKAATTNSLDRKPHKITAGVLNSKGRQRKNKAAEA